MSIKHTRALLRGALDGSLHGMEFRKEPFFGLSIPAQAVFVRHDDEARRARKEQDAHAARKAALAAIDVFAPLDEHDSLYTLLAAMAYGLRAYNLYMAVDRERWIGAPVDPHGAPRPLADAYRRLNSLFDTARLHELRRRVPVRLVVPRALRRLARATHAFGPVTPTLFNVIGVGFRDSCLEEELGTGEVPTFVAESFLLAFERALLARGVPFAYAGGDSVEESTAGASWIVCASVAGLNPEFIDKLQTARKSGARVTLGPRVPSRDGQMRTMAAPHAIDGLEVCALDEATEADALVAERVRELGGADRRAPRSPRARAHRPPRGGGRRVHARRAGAHRAGARRGVSAG
jgi:beta-galactosidase